MKVLVSEFRPKASYINNELIIVWKLPESINTLKLRNKSHATRVQTTFDVIAITDQAELITDPLFDGINQFNCN